MVTFTVGNSNSSGVVELESISFSVYPNPVRDYFTISWINLDQNQSVMYITNALGETVLTKTYSASTGSDQIDVSGLARGIYFVHLTNGTTTKTIKLVVARK